MKHELYTCDFCGKKIDNIYSDAMSIAGYGEMGYIPRLDFHVGNCAVMAVAGLDDGTFRTVASVVSVGVVGGCR